MEEQKEGEQTQEESKEETVAIEEDGDEASKIVADAKRYSEELKKQNDEKRKLLDREDKIISRREALNQLGGGSMAGKGQEKHEETPKEYKDRIMKGEL